MPAPVAYNFYNMGVEKMQEYLQDTILDNDAIDMLGDLVVKYSAAGEDLDTAAEHAAMRLVEMNAHWRDIADSPWFEEIKKTIRQAVGYTDADGSGEFKNLPANLKHLQKEQLLKNEEFLMEQVLDGLWVAETTFLEDGIRGFFREFDENYVEKPKQVQPEVVEEEEQKEEQEDTMLTFEEPADYSGRFAHAVA